jgi:hypothetical protein
MSNSPGHKRNAIDLHAVGSIDRRGHRRILHGSCSFYKKYTLTAPFEDRSEPIVQRPLRHFLRVQAVRSVGGDLEYNRVFRSQTRPIL